MRQLNHEQYILRCLELAQKGKGYVSPNPMVGAVLVHDGRIIGEGWHQQFGQAHAEVNCLDSVSDADKTLIPDSTMYVSLEPCAHLGKTPPCAERLVTEQVKQVIVCNGDPFAKVSGKGMEILNTAGINTSIGLLEDKGLWVNRRFFCYHQQQRPYIILKWAQTKDGYIAPPDRSRTQISNKAAGQLVHKWRTEEDAIMVGYQTALHDDPQLTTRLWQGKNPLRIVVDKDQNLPNTGKIFDTHATTWILNRKNNAINDNLHYIQLDFERDIIPQLLKRLYQAGIQSLIVEGGAALLNSFIKANIWDEARVFTAEHLLNEGIKAPVLQNANHVLQASVSTDELNVYVHQNSSYPYVAGCEL